MYKPGGYYIIKGVFTWVQLDKILGKSECGLQTEYDTKPQPCGLASGIRSYKVYCDWIDGIGSRSAHVVMHWDGVCFSGSLRVEQDWAFAKELFDKVVACFEKYQKVLTEVHSD